MDSYAQRLRLRDLKDLAKSVRNAGEDIVQTYYGWREARSLTLAKGTGAAALSVLTAWLIPLLKNEYERAPLWLVVVPPLALVVSLALTGAVAFVRMDRIHQSFIRAMVWLQRLR